VDISRAVFSELLLPIGETLESEDPLRGARRDRDLEDRRLVEFRAETLKNIRARREKEHRCMRARPRRSCGILFSTSMISRGRSLAFSTSALIQPISVVILFAAEPSETELEALLVSSNQ
jgi:hypothetical protein